MSAKQRYIDAVVEYARLLLPRDVPVCIDVVYECWENDLPLDEAGQRLYDDSIYFTRRF